MFFQYPPFFDLLDMNPNCRRPVNTWTGNTFVTKSPGALVFARRCGECHRAYAPGSMTWPSASISAMAGPSRTFLNTGRMLRRPLRCSRS